MVRESGEGDLQGWRGERYIEDGYVPVGLKRWISEQNRYLRKYTILVDGEGIGVFEGI